MASFNWHSDINECKVLMEKCAKNAECLNSEGSYSCQCKLGFIGDGYSYCTGNELFLSKFPATRYCGEWVRATVTTVANFCISNFSCTKWSTPADALSLLSLITDINECLNVTCGENAECLNTEGTYSCQCKSGFTGDGYNCADQSCMLYYIIIILVVDEHTLILRSIPLRYKVCSKHYHEWGTEVGTVLIVSWNLTIHSAEVNKCTIIWWLHTTHVFSWILLYKLVPSYTVVLVTSRQHVLYISGYQLTVAPPSSYTTTWPTNGVTVGVGGNKIAIMLAL